MIDADNVLKIIDALMPLLVGALTTVASLFGVNLRNKWQDRREVNSIRSKSISALFAHINESERNIIKIRLCIESKKDIDDALDLSICSVKNLVVEYDKSAVYFPDSIAQIVEGIINHLSTINAYALTGDREKTLQEITHTETSIKRDKKDLRNAFQYMIGIKK